MAPSLPSDGAGHILLDDKLTATVGLCATGVRQVSAILAEDEKHTELYACPRSRSVSRELACHRGAAMHLDQDIRKRYLTCSEHPQADLGGARCTR